jgi:hypothetical protein
MNNGMTTIESSARPRLRLPVQATPVYRTRSGAALAGDSGIEASQWQQVAGQIAGHLAEEYLPKLKDWLGGW